MRNDRLRRKRRDDPIRLRSRQMAGLEHFHADAAEIGTARKRLAPVVNERVEIAHGFTAAGSTVWNAPVASCTIIANAKKDEGPGNAGATESYPALIVTRGE